MPSHPRSRPLPLTGRRGFEAAARLLSFTLAAHELGLTHQALDAALHEQGVMLAPSIYVHAHLASGRLIAPPGRPMPSGWGYDLVVNRDSARQRHVAAFIAWLETVFAQAGGRADRG